MPHNLWIEKLSSANLVMRSATSAREIEKPKRGRRRRRVRIYRNENIAGVHTTSLSSARSAQRTPAVALFDLSWELYLSTASSNGAPP